MSHLPDPLRETCERLGLCVEWPPGPGPAVVRRGDRQLFRGSKEGVAPYIMGMQEGISLSSWSRSHLLAVLGLPPAGETAAVLDELARLQAVRLEMCISDADSFAALLAHPNRRVRELALRALSRAEPEAP